MTVPLRNKCSVFQTHWSALKAAPVCWFRPKRSFFNVRNVSVTTVTASESTLNSESNVPALEAVGLKPSPSRGNVSREQECEGKQGETGLLSETAK